ncbi:hypothetical protein [Sodalis-like endosymbiont of Proechinophthirus fluctus]|uniref:hypothetical protein n=1 Tax=Sodalis-like endosymbiont of Proechinophthirus fluctus TaxID=1462730 RepID=UPI000B3119A3|nr:hypothetical protein [Sodalis-like endosymbiont of Proechinophthirus fluctus]
MQIRFYTALIGDFLGYGIVHVDDSLKITMTLIHFYRPGLIAIDFADFPAYNDA